MVGTRGGTAGVGNAEAGTGGPATSVSGHGGTPARGGTGGETPLGGSAGKASGAGGAGGRDGSAGSIELGGAAGQSESPDYPFLALFAIAKGAGVLVAAGSELAPEGQTGVFYRSMDGLTWTRVAGGFATNPTDIEYGNGHFVALGSSYDLIAGGTPGGFVSEDGEHWEETSLPVSELGTHFAFGNGAFVAAGRESQLFSEDGKAWTTFGPGSAYAVASVEFAAHTFLSWKYGQADAWLFSAPDASGNSVAINDPSANQSRQVVDLRTLNDRFVGVSQYDCCLGEVPLGGSYWPFMSTDGHVWTFGEESAASPPMPVIDDGTVCVAFTSSSILSGPTCNSLDVVFSEAGFGPSAALASDGRYFVVGSPKGGILSSTDGVTWSKVLWN